MSVVLLLLGFVLFCFSFRIDGGLFHCWGPGEGLDRRQLESQETLALGPGLGRERAGCPLGKEKLRTALVET